MVEAGSTGESSPPVLAQGHRRVRLSPVQVPGRRDRGGGDAIEVVIDAAVYPRVLDELIPSAWHHVEQYANNPIEADHGRLKHRLRPMHGLQTDRTTEVIIAGHAFMQNLRRGHYELGIDAPPARRVAAAFGELARLQNHTVLIGHRQRGRRMKPSNNITVISAMIY
jgi:hypothetical protein